MAKGKRKEEYDLNKSFNDSNRNSYRSSESLELWARFGSEFSLVKDLSPHNLSVTGFGSPNYNKRRVADKKAYYALSQTNLSSNVFGNVAHWASRIGPAPGGHSMKITMSAWIYAYPMESNTHAVICSLGSNDARFTRQLISGSEYLSLVVDDTDSVAAQWRSNTPLPQNQWVHVAVTLDMSDLSSNTPTFYVNGEAQDFTVISAGDSPFAGVASYGLVVGWSSSSFTGQSEIAECCVWSSVLSAEEIRAVHNASVSKMYEIGSGYLTSPVKTIIRDNDYKTGSYPSNLRTGDRDFKGNSTVGVLFDDTKVIDFVSPFPTAEIEIKAPGPDMHRSWIGLTSSVDTFTKNFEFVTANEGEIIVNSRGAELVLMGAQPAPGAGFMFFVNEPKIHTPTQLAEVMANSINKYSDDLDLVAKASGGKITLVSKVPGPLNTTLHGEISSGSEDFSRSVYKIKQFGTGTQHSPKLSYPTLLPDASQYANTNIASPSSPPDAKSFKEAKAGVADYGISFTPGENISPFNDERIFLGISEFYQTGTLPSILEGFDAPLSSKTQIVMDFVTTGSLTYGSPIFQLTQSLGLPGSRHAHLTGMSGSGFAYWNDDINKWEMLGYHGFKDPRSLSSEDRMGALRGFTQPNYMITDTPYNAGSGDTEVTIKQAMKRWASIGQPTNTSGFPFAPQYEATGSQCIDMSRHINLPFLLEKMTVSFEGVLGTTGQHISNTLDQIDTKTFFVLAQKSTKEKSIIRGAETVDFTEKEGSSVVSLNRVVNTSGHREVVTYAKIGLVHRDNQFKAKSTRDDYNDFRDSFDKLVEYNDADTTNRFVSSSFTMTLTPKLGLNADNIAYYTLTGSGGSDNYQVIEHSQGSAAIDGNSKGGANLRGDHSGRQLSVAMDVADIALEDLSFPGGITGKPLVFRSEYSKASPYLLFPEDKLIFGWENHHIINVPNPNSKAKGNPSGNNYAENSVDHIKKMKITLFGSLIRSDKEYHDTLNQPLTSDGIHETIYGAPVLDQWDVEPMTVLSGSTRDALFFGDMFSNSTQFASNKITAKTISSVLQPENNDSFTISVPVSIGGESSTPVTILFKDGAGTGAANQIRIRRNANGGSANAANFASLLVHAINGTSPDGETRPDGSGGTFAAADVGFATSGVGQNGIPGITAFKNNAASPSVIITADQPGPEGDKVTFTDTAGNFIDTVMGASPTRLKGGGVRVRGRRGSIVAGHAGRTGSLGRNEQYFDANVIYSDSRISSIGSFLNLTVPTATPTIAYITQSVGHIEPRNILALSNRASNPTSRLLYLNDVFSDPQFESSLETTAPAVPIGTAGSSETWAAWTTSGMNLDYLSIGIEDCDNTVEDSDVNYKDLMGSLADAKGVNNFGGFSSEVSAEPENEPFNIAAVGKSIVNVGTKNIFEETNKKLQRSFEGFGSHGNGLSIQDFSTNALADSYRALYGTIFGLPNTDPNLFGGSRRFPGVFENGVRIPYLTGFKFGFFNIFPTSPVYHFRRSSFGQFRDLIESPVEAKMHGLKDLADEDNGDFTADQDAQTPPVKIIFMSRGGEANIDPADTNAQNLSIFSTSSKPYFDDDVSRERDVVNFPPPDMTDRTSISEDVSVLIDPPEGS